LIDVPNDFIGLDKQILQIDEYNNRLIPISYTFNALLDTPDEYTEA